jgi:hypothetical protein
VLALILMCLSAAASGAEVTPETVPGLLFKGEIDWTRGLVTATGTGEVPAGSSSATGYHLARRAAMAMAQRNLAGILSLIRIDSHRLVSDLQKTDRAVKISLEAFVKGAQPISERRYPDGRVELVMVASLYGISSVGETIIQEVAAKPRESAAPAASPEAPVEEGLESPPTAPPVPAETPAPRAAQEIYTGLIVDCRGLNIRSSVLPSILSQDGKIIYESNTANFRHARSIGLVGYCRYMEEALADSSRVGKNPLVIKAMEAREGQTPVCPVISRGDASRLLASEAEGGFLERCGVILLLDMKD